MIDRVTRNRIANLPLVERAPTVNEFLELRAAVGWHAFERGVAAVALRHSLFAVCAEDKGRAIACGRVVGDAGAYFYVQDILVHPGYQRRGLAGAIMEKVCTYLDGAAGPGAFIGLMSAPGLERFYARYGFERFPADSPGMMIWREGP